MAGMDTPKISMGAGDAIKGWGSVAGAAHHFQSAHLLSALEANTSSPGSFLMIL